MACLLMHDTTAKPALTDLAAVRDVVAERGADPTSILNCLPVHISIDHSLAVDACGFQGSGLGQACRPNEAHRHPGKQGPAPYANSDSLARPPA